MSKRWILLAVAVVALTACTLVSPPQQGEADRIARVVGDAISYPRQTSGAGYVRAALDTAAGEDGRLVVVEMTKAAGPGAIWASRLTFRVHLAAIEHDWGRTTPALTACYHLTYSQAGLIDGPHRTGCPLADDWVEVPPAPPRMRTPIGTFEAVQRRLRAAPDLVDAGVFRRTIIGAMPEAPVDSLSPQVTVGTDGTDVGVAVRDDDGCLLGARLDGHVLVWVVDRAQAQPGEIACTPTSALQRQGIHPPH